MTTQLIQDNMAKETKKDIAKKHADDLLESETSLPSEEKKEVAIIEGQPLVPQNFKTALSNKQIATIKEQFAKGATDVELQMFLYVCQRTGLDPFSKQIHLVPRWDSKLGKEVRAVIIGIDGLRSVAERTGAYAGNSDPAFQGELEIEYTEKNFATKVEKKMKMTVPARATVTVKKVVQGVICDFVSTAEWTEYYPGEKSGMMWRKMPTNMLGKCAEAKALRKAFPAVMSGLYVQEEMHQAVAPEGAEKKTLEETDFDKAIRMISAVKDAKGLEAMKSKFEESTKYTKSEKNQIIKKVESRIKELQPKEDASETSPKL
jgi:phage recombination protein Bet